MGKSVTGEKIIIPKARIAFTENLFEAGSVNGGAPQFSSILILQPTDPICAVLEAEEVRLAQLAWPQNWQAMLAMIRAANGQALKPGELKAKFDGFAGNKFLSTSNKVRPTVVNSDATPLTAQDGVIYSGAYVLAHVSLWTQDNQFGQKINANLLGVQFVEDGDAFGSGAPPSTPDQFANLSAAGGAPGGGGFTPQPDVNSLMS